jgi:hypothetical protein
MTLLQIVSATAPYDRPAVGMRAARLLGLAEAMGLLPSAEPIARLDRETILPSVRHLQRHGIGRNAAFELGSTDDPERLAALLDKLYEELLGSPTPETEAGTLGEALGHDLAAQLAGISSISLRRYIAAERATPDAVAARLHHLAVIVSHLSAGYNQVGIRRWFSRPRPQLDGRAPDQLLEGDWNPDADGPQRVLHLAEALNSSPAT